MKQRNTRHRLITAVIACVFSCLLIVSCGAGAGQGQTPTGKWSLAKSEYLIKIGDDVAGIHWNDPSVMKDGDDYVMWLSGGDPKDINHIVVDLYRATSKDGVAWAIDKKPILTPSKDKSAWDSMRIETPSVVKVDGKYHLYYSGTDEEGAKVAIYSIGHATSDDGINWKKDENNPVITAQKEDKTKWGWRGVGEPGMVYNPKDKMFYLYYVSMRFNPDNPTLGEIGILLSRSKDGSKFEPVTDEDGQRKLILTRNVPNATDGAWFGYSTPSAMIDDDGKFHLFTAFIIAPAGPTTARHIGLDHAISDDGINFKTTETNILAAGKGDWLDQQVRSPSPLISDGKLMLWFAGETRKPFYQTGIGLIVRQNDE